jgi:hypothetical protein
VKKEIGEYFQAVSAMDILFHIVDDNKYKKALYNIYDLICPGGFFFLSGNFLHSETRRSQHIVHRSLSDARQALQDVGFVILDRQPVFMLMNKPVDSTSGLFKKLWPRIYQYASRSEKSGAILGAFLFPIEMMLTRLFSESPTTEIMVCKKPVA